MQFATGVCIGVPYIFDFSSGYILNLSFDYFGLGFSLSIGFLICCVSFACAIALIKLQNITDAHDKLKLEETEPSDEEKIAHEFKLQDLKDLEPIFWINCLAASFSIGVITTSSVLASDMLVSRFTYSEGQAGSFITMPAALTAVCMPALGQIVDSIGYRMSFIMLMCLILAGAHFQMLMIDD